MRHTILISLVFIFLANTLSTQNWTPPINVSNTNGFIIHSDFTIDNEGIIHCVWDFKFNSNYSVIYYSFSEDDGVTWSEKVNISQNDTNYCCEPRIAYDSNNNVYVGYDLNDYSPQNWGSFSTLVVKDSIGWNMPQILSEGIGTFPVIDFNNRLYVFWFEGAPHNGEFHYKFHENEMWSEVFCPFNNEELTGLVNIVVDNNNNLHCVGVHDSTGLNDTHPMYLNYNYITEEWGNMTDFEEKNQTQYIDIALDTNQFPIICWGGDALYYSQFDGIVWSETDTISLIIPRKVAIVVDTIDNTHIVINTSEIDGMKLIYFHKPDGTYWTSSIVDNGDNVIFTPNLEHKDNNLYLSYTKSDSIPYADIFLTKLDLITSLPYTNIPLSKSIDLYQNSPNPFSKSTSIEFFTTGLSTTKVYVCTIDGRHVKTLFEGKKSAGIHSVQWDGTNSFNQSLPSGLYISIIQNNEHIITKKMIYQP